MQEDRVKRKSKKAGLDRSTGKEVDAMRKDSVALQFNSRESFREALEILWKLREITPEIIPFALPPAENTLIINKKYTSHFDTLHPAQQTVGSTADLPIEEANRLRRKHFWPTEEKE